MTTMESTQSETPLTLVLDQGGHASRALVFDGIGTLVAQSFQPIETHHRDHDRVEHDAEALVASMRRAIVEVAAALGERCTQITAAGLATQRSSVVCWHRQSGEALSPVISWQDRRTAEWLLQFDNHADWIHKTTGLVMSPHYGASKLRWCLDHIPAVKEVLAQGRLACGPLACFLAFRLLEERPWLVDPVSASRTLLWNIRSGDWEPDLLQLFGVPRHVLPDCVPNSHVYGHVLVGGVRVPLTIVTGDQPASLFSQGRPDPGSAYVNIGTGAFIQRVSREYPQDDDDLLTGVIHADGQRTIYALEGTVNGAAKALQWLQTQQPGLDDVEVRLEQWMAACDSPPLFLNGVSGLGSPFWISDFHSAFVGEGEPWQKAVAVAESIVFLIQVNLEEMTRIHGRPERLVISGGLASVEGICQRLADLSGLAVSRPAEKEATARGTAFLAADRPAYWPEPSPADVFQPRPTNGLGVRFAAWCAAMIEALSIAP